MFSLVNKHEEFFDFLVTNAEYFHKGTLMAKEVLQDPTKLEKYSKEVKNLEHAADRVTHDMQRRCAMSSSHRSIGKIFLCRLPHSMTVSMTFRMSCFP